MMRALLVFMLVVPLAAFAAGKKKVKTQTDDTPAPYSEQSDEDDRNQRELPDKSEPTKERPEEQQVEQDDRMISLASQDDPNVGLSGELLLGTMLLESQRGSGVQPQFMIGLRFTWEWSRTLLTDEFWREVFFVDVAYFATRDDWSGSSSQIFGTSGPYGVLDKAQFHYFTLAPAVGWPFKKVPLTIYAQAGIGFGYQSSTVYVEQVANTISASRLLIQYGGGIRLRIGLTSDDKIRLAIRLELTRFRRGYMDDTFVGGGLGVVF
jgi:hypothetical protein